LSTKVNVKQNKVIRNKKASTLLREEPDKTDEQVAEMVIYGKEEK
jgi:hypothetical protein